MTEQTEADQATSDKRQPLSVSRPGRLEIKKTVEAGQVRQSFSHGRSKAVAVEVRRKRTFTADSEGGMTEIKEPFNLSAGVEEVAAPAESVALKVPAEDLGDDSKGGPAILRTLTDEEKAARARALVSARVAEDHARRAAARRAAEEAAQAETERRRLDEERRLLAELRALQPAPEDTGAEAAPEAAATPTAAALPAAEEVVPAAPSKDEPAVAARVGPATEEEETEDEAAALRRRAGRPEPRRPSTRRTEPRRRAGKLTIVQALDDEEKQRSLASVRRARERERRILQKSHVVDLAKIVREVVIPETITVQELANRMAVRGVEVIKSLMRMGVMATIDQTIEADTAELIVAEFGHLAKRVSAADVEIGLHGPEDDPVSLQHRPPVVTVMGHVDHGKTSLLDALRQTNVVAGEAGGITQHIGAYQVTLPSGGRITFIDTPGHAAFTEMRSRGARATDIVVLVVAADDGVMPQTVEAINHAKAAKVPIIVAINKIDRPNADPDRVRNALLAHELVVESLGGDIQTVEVSATKKLGLEALEEAILLQAEVLELKVNPDRAADGVVIEAKLDRGRGAVASVLVQRGTLRVGDTVVAGTEWGRVRALVNDSGATVTSAGPSMPVEVLGLSGVPFAGDEFIVVENESRAREVTKFRTGRDRDERVATGARGTLEQMFNQIAAGVAKELPLVIKADVQGSAEAIADTLNGLSTDEVKVRILHSGVGAINESDVTLAHASGALLVGFNVRANAQATEASKRDGVDIRYYAIIYELADDIKAMLSGMLAPEARETILGNARIKEVFSITKVGRVAGCEVSDGLMRRGARVRLLRDSVVVHEGTLSSLKRFKDEVREVRAGLDCGMAFENYQDIKPGDVIECYDITEFARTL